MEAESDGSKARGGGVGYTHRARGGRWLDASATWPFLGGSHDPKAAVRVVFVWRLLAIFSS